MLIGADRRPRALADLAVDRALIEAAAGEQLLDFGALGARQRARIARPAGDEGAAAPQPVGEMPDPERIGIGVVVALDDAEVR